MTLYAVDFTYVLPEFGSIEFNAENEKEAEEMAIDYIAETYPEAEDLQIEEVRKVNG